MVAKVGLRYAFDGSPGVTTTVRILGMLLFEVEFVKPGCTAPRLEFLFIYWTTIALISIAGSSK